MKLNVKIVACLLAAAACIAVISCGVDRLKKQPEAEQLTPTPKISAPAETPEQDSDQKPEETQKPTLTAAPEATASPVPSEIPEETITPAATPTVTACVTPETTEPSEITTVEEAIVRLKQVSADELHLSRDISTYEIEGYEWTSMIQGKECFCLLVLDPSAGLAGSYYVALDGSTIYWLNEDEKFVPINK